MMLKKIGRKIRNKSIRWKLMVIVVTAFLIMTTSLLFTIKIDHYAISIIGGSFKSNEELNAFTNELAVTEKALENYMAYRSFESINIYFNASNKLEEFCSTKQEFPSTDVVKQKEYIVNQLALSFLFYSSKAVSSRRANSNYSEWYRKSLDCYKFLLEEVSNLNVLYMNRNTLVYNKDTKNVMFILRIYLGVFAIFFLLLLYGLYFFIGRITHPLKEISTVASRVAERDFDVPLFNKKTKDEIGNICRAFDRMIISIREYIDTIWEKARTENELREREMEMQALYADAQLKAFQSQINPHFLFNTLNTGAQLAMMEGADKTCYFIEQTSDFFRYNIQQQQQDVSISDELGLTDNFVYIMKVRFGQRLEFEKNVEEECYPEKLPVMTLQPLVENCIQHGLQNARGKVTLTVRRSGGFVTISLSDNGTGFNRETRQQILECARHGNADRKTIRQQNVQDRQEEAGREAHTGIGLINVFSRLRLYFHRDDVFDITDNPQGQGTTFIIRIPENV